MMKRNKGFTLVELMIVVAIIAILSAVAIPAYNDYVLRGKIAEAMTNLSSMRAQMEQYYQDNRSYQNPPAGGPSCGIGNAPLSTQYFAYTCLSPTTETYTITADGVGSMAAFGYTIDQANTRMTKTMTAPGWSVPNPNTCWATKPGGKC
jgi:type IV pilus assembly protein PilE